MLMTDRPRDAKWLNTEEREWLATTMDAELAAKSKGGSHNFLAGLKDKRTLTYSALYFGLVCGIYGLGLWMPTIVAALGKFSTAEVGCAPAGCTCACVCACGVGGVLASNSQPALPSTTRSAPKHAR